ncbi:MAG: phage antirepressor KilAC domain-containing protein [Sphingobacteriaceae bacterium]|nr:phage antirepressor KilAC domain-containing protein [Sphingobacteriaceae bacterium]
MKLVSTSALAKERNIDAKELFALLKDKGWIYKKDDQWHLTKEGRMAGGDMLSNPKFGDYVAWPSNINIEQTISAKGTLSATQIGENFKISSQKTNLYLKELGWIEKIKGGWVLTKKVRKMVDTKWRLKTQNLILFGTEAILKNSFLIRTIAIGEGNYIETKEEIEKVEEKDDFRKKYPAAQRTSDGHYVRSRAEQLIDNFLYQHGIVHAYERKLNIEEDMYCDFYLPEKKIYIEFWGLEENEKYAARKKIKQELYAKYNFNLIQLNDSDLENLDEILAAKLRKYNISVD